MKFAYKFANLLGTVYRKGNLVFSSDGNSVISPVGNRITVYDLKNNKTLTLPVESRFNFTTIALSPNGSTLLAVNEEGDAHLISMVSKRVIHSYRFLRPLSCVRFSPDSKHFAVAKENLVFVFKSPGPWTGDYNPFVMEHIFKGASDDVTCIDWSQDSRIVAVGSKDAVVRLYSIEKFINFRVYSLGSHTDVVVECFFMENVLDLITITRNGFVLIWECSIDPEALEVGEPVSKKKKQKEGTNDITGEEYDALHKNVVVQDVTEETSKESNNKLFYRRVSRTSLINLMQDKHDVLLTTAAYHKETHILVTGFSNGSFFIHELPDVNLIHSLSISEQVISTVTLNNTGDWIALGCSQLGQLLVWEWQSETYVMKQQGHFNNMSCLKYSPDGQYIVTGGDDGKVKLWNTTSGFCFVTFHEHTASVSAVEFSRNGKFIVSTSLDGTVRAFDMTRYRNFRTLTSPRPVQFICLAIDSSSEFVAAGGQDVFEVYLWSMRIGRLVEILCGHVGPVVSVAFSPVLMSTTLASISWDKTLKIWNAVESGTDHETVQLGSDGLFVTFSPSGGEIATATLDGQITFFDSKTAMQTKSIEGRNDLGSGRSDTDLTNAKTNLKGKAFTCLCYSADGQNILAGGQSKNVCIYNVTEGIILKKFEITQNHSFDAVDDFINRRKMTEFGNLALVEERDELEGGNATIRLPGVRKGDMAARAFKPEVRVSHLQFSPTGQAWAAATTEGLLLYTLDHNVVFDPFELEVGITPDSVKENLQEGKNSTALMMAIKLNESKIIQEVIENISPNEVQLTVESLPEQYMLRTLKFLANCLESTRHIEFYMIWIQTILTSHGLSIHGSKANEMPILLTLQKNLTRRYEDLSKICDYNRYTLQYIITLGKLKETAIEAKKEIEETEEMEIDDLLRVDGTS